MTTADRTIPGPGPRRFEVTPAWAAALLLVHVPLGLAMGGNPAVSTLHALCVFALGLAWAVAGHEQRVAAWGGYVAACDVLWRMTDAAIPWEFAKYALVLVFFLSIFRSRNLRPSVLSLTYLGLLVPSSLLAVWVLGPSLASDGIRFNLSGPLALAVAGWFFSRLTLFGSTYVGVLVAMAGPAISVGSLAVSGLMSSAELRFSDASNMAASGGYGPNQVSSVLGLGVVVSLFLLLTTRGPGWFRALLFSVMVGLASQSALTFSRGGLYTAAGAAAAGLPFLLRDRGARRRVVVGGTIAAGLTLFLVLPGLESFTGGALGSRFEDLDTTGRYEIAMADLMAWKEHPVLGVGTGLGAASRSRELGRALAAHTEWTRLVAEHGLFGLGAAVCLVAMGWRAVVRGRGQIEKALAGAMVVWGFLFMLHAGMRLAAPAFAIGLTQCRLERRRIALETSEPVQRAARVAPEPAFRSGR